MSNILNKIDILKILTEKFEKETKTPITQKHVSVLLDCFEELLLEEWKKTGEVKLLNIGKLKTTERAARNGINPKTKAPLVIAAKTAPKFTFNKKIKELINSK